MSKCIRKKESGLMSNMKLTAHDVARPITIHWEMGSKNIVVGTMACRSFIHLRRKDKNSLK